MSVDGYKLAHDLYTHAARVALTGQHAAYIANEAMVVTNDLDRLEAILDDLDIAELSTCAAELNQILEKVLGFSTSGTEEQAATAADLQQRAASAGAAFSVGLPPVPRRRHGSSSLAGFSHRGQGCWWFECVGDDSCH